MPLQDDIEEEVELLDQITAAITVLLTKYGDDAMALLEDLMPFFGELLDPHRSAAERRTGICVLDDIIEHSPRGELVLRADICVSALTSYVLASKCD